MLSTYSCSSFGTGKAGVAMLGEAAISARTANSDSNVAGLITPETEAAPDAVGSMPMEAQILRTAATASFVREGLRSRS